MGKSLVIVESPSKATIINRYLGDGYVVRASVGHIRDLPSGGEDSKKPAVRAARGSGSSDKFEALSRRMGVYPRQNWKADYVIMPGKDKVVAELKSLAKDADRIYLATDLDREGEAIAWHLKEVLGGDESRYLRVKYPEITRAAISAAFEHPGKINMDLVNAQQTRRFLDRVVGFMVSPILWKKVTRGLSAGRVQSVAVELIVDREREIRKFLPQEYWTEEVRVRTVRGDEFSVMLDSLDGKKAAIGNRSDAAQIAAELKAAAFVVSAVETKKGVQHAPPPFTTSTLQQAANQILGFSVRRTMTVAQHLYERGLITYMRTDSVNLSKEAVQAARDLIGGQFGAGYVPDKPVFHKSKDSAQEAHEAIRPSHPDEKLPSDVDRDGQRLYDLIYRRYLSSQMASLEYETTSVEVKAGRCTLKASGRHVLFDGFRRAIGQNRGDEVLLPEIHEGESLECLEVLPEQHFTQPPRRYSEATLVKQLEKDGIGRPSTYAAIISTIQDRGYVKVDRGRFYAEKMGEIVTDRLRYSFKDLMDPRFTAGMEDDLDKIAGGQERWQDSLDRFFSGFEQAVDLAGQAQDQGGMPENRPLEIELMCPQCGRYHMAVHAGRTGVFLACQGYYDKNVPAEERCRKTMNLSYVDPLANRGELSEDEEADLLRTRPRCPKCAAVMDTYMIDEQHKLHLCSAPNCDGYKLEQGDFSSEVSRGPQIECDKCGGTMVLKEGRFGKYMYCTNCGHTRKILRNGQVAPPKEDAVDLPELACRTPGSHFVLRDGAAGIFLAAHNFPKVRETRAPQVAELRRFRDRISPKFYYLADAPLADPEGNPTEVRFSRKTHQQYIMAVKADGKPSGWTAFYSQEQGKWEPRESKAAGADGSAKSAKSAKSGGTRRGTGDGKAPAARKSRSTSRRS